MKKYIVRLTAPERASLLSLTTRGESKARKRKRSLVLLSADEGAADAEIARQVRTSVSTVERVRQRFVEEGLEAALSERPRPGKARKLEGRQGSPRARSGVPHAARGPEALDPAVVGGPLGGVRGGGNHQR